MTAIPLGYSLKNLWARRLTTLLTAGGVGLVIFVFAAVLMLSHGLETALVATGSDANAIVLRRGAQSEFMSIVSRADAGIITSQPEVGTDPEGRPQDAAETLVLINLIKRATGYRSHVQVRGTRPEAFPLRPQLRLTAGRLWEPGALEVIAGQAVANGFAGVRLGGTLRFAARDWTVVGLFDAGGSGFESEIWLDSDQLIQAFRRPAFSSVTLRLPDAAAFAAFKHRLETDPRLNVEVKRETQYYADQSEMLAAFIRILGLFITVIFSLGATLAAMITMYAAVANRTLEIGTLRALGFTRGSILAAFLIESLALAFIGGVAGVGLAALLQSVTVTTVNFQTFAELAFGFRLSGAIVLQSLAFALLMGLAGGFLPAVRAARQEIVTALRSA